MKTYYKSLTKDGRAFYFLTVARALRFAEKCGGTYTGPAPINEVKSLIASALGS